MCSKRFSLKYTHFFSPRQKNLFSRASHACSVIPRLRPWNLSTVTAAPVPLRLRCGLERAKTERHRGLDEPTSPFSPADAGLTSADNARHAASRHRPLHGAHAHFRFRSRARTAAATGRCSAPSLLMCGERRRKKAAKVRPLSLLRRREATMAGELSLGGDDDPDDDVEPEQDEECEDDPQQDHVNVEVLCQSGADAADLAVFPYLV